MPSALLSPVLALAAASSLMACAGTGLPTATPTPMTPAGSSALAIECDGVPTPPQTEGPYYKTGSPERRSLAGEGGGTLLTIRGAVTDEACNPIAGAWVDFWQTDATGNYDNNGFGMRGHQYTDSSGRFSLETVLPGRYPGRPPHIHVKVRAPGGPVLTTQLYFADSGSVDAGVNPALLVDTTPEAGGIGGNFTFVLRP